jgi:putative ABC transport system permease protein
MRLTTVVLRNILRRPARSALTVAGVAIAVAAVVALVGISRGFERSLRMVYESRGVDLMVIRAGSTQRFSSVLDEGLGQKIAAVPGVSEVSPGLADVVSSEEADMTGIVIQGVPLEGGPLAQMRIVAGRRIEPGDGQAVLLGRVLARGLNKRVGDALEVVKGQSYCVVGIYEASNVFENGSMIMALDQLQRLMGRKGEVTHFTVIAKDKDRRSLENVAERIRALAPSLDVLPTREYIETSVEIRTARAAAWLTSSIALILGAIGMVNTMLTAVFERTRELAILQAIGWQHRRIVQLILLEAVLLALAGAVVGTVLAVGLTQVLCRLPEAGRLVSGDIAPEVIVQGFVIALLVGVAGGIYPAYRATRFVPTEGLRHE